MESLPMGTFQTLQHLGDFCKLKIGKLTCGGKWSMIHFLVGGAITILKNMKVNGKDDNPYIMENKKCLKPPTSPLSIYICAHVKKNDFPKRW